MHKKIFFLTFTLFVCGAVFAAEKRPVSPTTQGKLNQQLKESILEGDLSKFSKSIQNVANINAALTSHQDTPLHLAATRSGLPAHITIVKALIEHKAETNLKNKYGRTPLYTYICHDPLPEIVALLLDAKADPTISDFEGDNPLYLTKTNNQPIIDIFIKKGFTPFHTQAGRQHLQNSLMPFLPIQPLTHIVISYALPLFNTDDVAF